MNKATDPKNYFRELTERCGYICAGFKEQRCRFSDYSNFETEGNCSLLLLARSNRSSIVLDTTGKMEICPLLLVLDS